MFDLSYWSERLPLCPLTPAWGVNSIKGIQLTCANVGYTGPIDGVPGANTCHYVQVYAQRFGSYTGPVDSILGPNSWSGFALGLERP
jgi:peptidoglycan hydrolase-like protein with peptidoglycan-binding domain